MSTAWFLNEELEPYQHDVATQEAEFPNDDHTPYPTRDEALFDAALARIGGAQAELAKKADDARIAFDKAHAALIATAWPELWLDGLGNALCPYGCGPVDAEEGMVEVDCAVRWNRTSIVDDNVTVSQDDSEFVTLAYMVTCCNRPVDLPEGWESSWG